MNKEINKPSNNKQINNQVNMQVNTQVNKQANVSVHGATLANRVKKEMSINLLASSPWLLIQRDNVTLINIACDQQQPENSRMSALEILGRRGDGAIEKKLALLSKKDGNTSIKRAAYRALSRSQYTRSKQGSHVTKILEGIR